MERSRKTANELEQMLLSRLREEAVCPPGLTIKIVRLDGRWDAVAEFQDKEKHPNCIALAVLATTDLRARYDLED